MNDGLLLALDTAGPRCAVALVDARGTVLAARDPEIGRGHAERLMPLAGDVLGEAGATWRDVARIAVTVGPGSFTGLRVGVAAARGLALALGVPVVGASTLEVLAEPFREREPVLAVIDAKRGELYLAGYGAADAVLREPAAVRLEDLASLLETDLPPVVVGSGAFLLATALGRTDLVERNPENRIDLSALARLALRREPGEPPRPLYLRGADAKPQQSGIPRSNLAGSAASALF